MKNKKNVIVTIGFIVLIILIFAWAYQMTNIVIGYNHNGIWYGDTPEIVTIKRTEVNMKIGLWMFIVFTSIGTYLYINKDKK